jgi:Protein of unknown function (DUF3182)
MTRGVVLVYFGRLGRWLRPHQELMLELDAKAIAGVKQYEFGGRYQDGFAYPGRVYFVPDETLLLEEASSLGISSCDDLYGGVVPKPFVKTKSIAHPLVGGDAERPDGWSITFPERVREVVLRGYSAFRVRDARAAAVRMLRRGEVRVKQPLATGGRGQTLVTTIDEFDALLEKLPENDIANYGIVIEENLGHVTTRSVGQVTVDDLTVSYFGTQRRTTNNGGQSVYGGSNLLCVRGGWEALDGLAIPEGLRLAVTQARRYDEATSAYPGFVASRRNYDIGEGLDAEGRPRSGVFEASWRVGGATGAEIIALKAFKQDPSLHVIDVSHFEEFGQNRRAPEGAVVLFEGDDARDGPMIRYTIVNRMERRAE